MKNIRFQPDNAITSPIASEVVGPDAETVTIGFRLPGNKADDVLLADLVGQILNQWQSRFNGSEPG